MQTIILSSASAQRLSSASVVSARSKKQQEEMRIQEMRSQERRSEDRRSEDRRSRYTSQFVNIRNSSNLTVRTKDNRLRPLTSDEVTYFEFLRQGRVLNNLVGDLINKELLVASKSAADEDDRRGDEIWWKGVNADSMRIFQRNTNRLFVLNEKQRNHCSAFLQYHEFPLRALSLGPGHISISKNYDLEYKEYSDTEVVELVSIEYGDYLDETNESIRALANIYNTGYAFPIDLALGLVSTALYHDRTRVFYMQGAALDHVKALTLEREPANINMIRLYNKSAMQTRFGWKEGAYARLKDPPNIAIYTLAQVRDTEQLRDVHILHAIGLAFDNELQPDYQKYMALSESARRRAVVAFYTNLFQLIFLACRYWGFTSLVMSKVGAKNFASKYKDNEILGDNVSQFQDKIWWPTWNQVRARYPDIKDITFMGLGESAEDEQWEDIGLFPECVKKKPQSLFVNSWDCWSIVGNGNAGDESLDGYVGRSSTAAVASWPKTNMYMTDRSYIMLEVPQ
jgi:hypothetical protein